MEQPHGWRSTPQEWFLFVQQEFSNSIQWMHWDHRIWNNSDEMGRGVHPEEIALPSLPSGSLQLLFHQSWGGRHYDLHLVQSRLEILQRIHTNRFHEVKSSLPSKRRISSDSCLLWQPFHRNWNWFLNQSFPHASSCVCSFLLRYSIVLSVPEPVCWERVVLRTGRISRQ